MFFSVPFLLRGMFSLVCTWDKLWNNFIFIVILAHCFDRTKLEWQVCEFFFITIIVAESLTVYYVTFWILFALQIMIFFAFGTSFYIIEIISCAFIFEHDFRCDFIHKGSTLNSWSAESKYTDIIDWWQIVAVYNKEI